jgi:hypothetical protein
MNVNFSIDSFFDRKKKMKEDSALFQEAKEKKEGRGSAYFFAAILSFLKGKETVIAFLRGLAILVNSIL